MLSRRSAVWSFVLALVGVLFLALPDTARAQNQVMPGRIVGLVVDAAGAPVPGAHVVLRHGDTIVARALTGPGGRFEFPHVRPGLYLVAADKLGVGRGREPVAVSSGKVSRVKITLKRI